MISKCEPCVKSPASKFQDETYGKNMRVHTIKKNKSIKCTCCGKIK